MNTFSLLIPVGISLKIKVPDANKKAIQLNNKAVRGLSCANNSANKLIGFAYQANSIKKDQSNL